MNTFEQAGEGMLLAHEGQQQIARALAAKLMAVLARFGSKPVNPWAQVASGEKSAKTWMAFRLH